VRGKTYGIYMADKELGAVHKPNSYNSNSVINNLGFRNTQDIAERKPVGATRIYCSGGSSTFCYNLPTEQSWPSLLQRKLRKIPGRERDEVLNAGEICFAISHEFSLARRLVPRLKPDIVILYGSGINEILAYGILEDKEDYDFDELLKQKKWGIFPKKLDQARFLKRHSTFVKFCDYAVKKIFEKKLKKDFLERFSSVGKDYPHQWVMQNFDNTLRNYLTFLRKHKCKVIIVPFGDSGTEGRYLDLLRRFRDRAVKIGIRENVIICDFAALVKKMPNREALFIDEDVHLTAEGVDALSDALLNVLINQQALRNARSYDIVGPQEPKH
jgi:lysophospholipase L1-like esterase